MKVPKFKNIKDNENTFGNRLFANSLGAIARVAMALGLPNDTPPITLIRTYVERLKNPIKPIRVRAAR